LTDPISAARESLYRAVEHFQNGRWMEARACFERALSLAPDDFDTLHLWGVLEHRQNNLEKAESLIRRAIDLDPAMAEAHYNLGRVLQDRGQAEAMLEAYQRAIALDPALEFAHFNLGLAHLNRGETDLAVAAFRKARQLNPRDADYAFNLGLALQRRGDSDEAMKAYQQAIGLNPGYAQAHNNLGILLKETGRHADAMACYRRAIRAAPDYADAFFNLGNAAEEAGQMVEAQRAYRDAIAHRPDFAKAHNNLGNVCYAAGDHEQALAAYRRAQELDPAMQTARHMVNCLSGETSDAAPAEYVKSLFDKAAGEFEDRLVGDLEYRSPSELKALLDGMLEPGHRFENAIDLGCGTGLAAQAFHSLTRRIAGVDVSPRMVDRAREKNLYAALAVGDLLPFLAASADTFDLILATDVLVYFGNLQPLFDAVRARAADGAYFLFSLEALEGEGDFVLRKTGRYAHSRGYIQRLAREAGFAVLSDPATVIRMEKGLPIPGINFILKKNGSSQGPSRPA